MNLSDKIEEYKTTIIALTLKEQKKWASDNISGFYLTAFLHHVEDPDLSEFLVKKLLRKTDTRLVGLSNKFCPTDYLWSVYNSLADKNLEPTTTGNIWATIGQKSALSSSRSQLIERGLLAP